MEELEQKDKYYTPSLEEFFVGFEFEHFNYEGKLVSNPKWNKKDWNKEICDADWFNILLDEYEHDEDAVKDYRVKYLDVEDIESFGFKPDPSGERYFELGGYQLYVNIHPIHNITIYNEAATIIFQGTVKNANELKKVLQMIGVL